MAARFAVPTSLAFAAIVVLFADLGAEPQPPRPPAAGNRIVAQDGDTIVLQQDARVRIVRRREAMLRTVFNATERWLVLLVDYADKAAPDGLVDGVHDFRDIRGEWPWEERWQGPGAIETSSLEPGGFSDTLTIVGPRGAILLLRQTYVDIPSDPNTTVLSYTGGGFGMGLGISFDQAEQGRLAEIRGKGLGTVGIGRPVEVAVSPGRTETRVFSSGLPVKLVDAAPVVPEQAVRAGIKGVVILEITIGTDGSVKDARVLRSIPLLDQAAVDAVRQWRYEPPFVNGQPSPILMTVTVPFR